MTHSSHFFHLDRISGLCREILENRSASITPEMSLTRDLGFDSMRLMSFFAGIESTYPGVALEDWFLDHCTSGKDTVGSVAAHVAEFSFQIAAE